MNAPARNRDSEFAAAMGTLKAAYTGYRPEPEEWRAMLRVWSERLSRYPVQAVNRAVWRATKSYPDRFPTLGQLEAIVVSIAKTLSDNGEPRKYLPVTNQGREAYLLEADSPCEQLARLWELEDAGRKGPVPQEEGARRLAQILSVMDKHTVWAKAKKVATKEAQA